MTQRKTHRIKIKRRKISSTKPPRRIKVKRSKGSRKRPPRRIRIRRKPSVPRTARQYFSMPEKDQETWDSVAQIISRVRAGDSLTRASTDYGIPRNVVIDLGRPALRKKNGRYVATKRDTLLRVVTVLTVKGKEVIATRDSRQASLVGSHWAAVQRYLQTGDDSALKKFQGKKITDASGKRHLVLTDLKELDRLAAAGVLSFESIYAGGAR